MDLLESKEKKINNYKDINNKIIIEADKQYIIDKNRYYSTNDNKEVTIVGVNEENELICNHENDEILLKLDDIKFENEDTKIIPFIFYNDIKIFFNQRQQKLIDTNRIVTVIRYAGDGLMLCKYDDGTEVKCKPEKDFVNFKEFSDVLKNRTKGTNIMYPIVKFVSEELDSVVYAKIFPYMQETKLKINDEIKDGKIIGNTNDKTKLLFKYDDDEIEVSLDDLENNDYIKRKAITAFKKKQSSTKDLSNVINIEKNVDEKISYVNVVKGEKKEEKNVVSDSNNFRKELKKLREENEELKNEIKQIKNKYKKLVNKLIDDDFDFNI